MPYPNGGVGPKRDESVSRKRKLTAGQEKRRMEGLRMLARIIARHYLANPHLYRNGAGGEGPPAPAKGRTTDGDAARKEGAA